MNSRKIKTWAWVHKWSSLVCTVFMLLLCITGLPLIFHHEIGHLLGTEVEAPKMAAGTPHISLDRVLDIAKAQLPRPRGAVRLAARGQNNLWFVTLTPTPDPTDDFKSVAVDARTGAGAGAAPFDEGFMYIMFKLHVDLFAGCRASSSWASWACCCWWPSSRAWCCIRRSCASSTSARCGMTLGAPEVARPAQPAGHRHAGVAVRGGRHRHDQHLGRPAGASTGRTTSSQTCSRPTRASRRRPVAERAFGAALAGRRAAARARHQAVVHCLPGTAFSSPHHTTFFLRGNEPLTSKLFQPVLVDAKTAPGHGIAQAAVVPDGAAGVAAAALRRLRRHADADPLGAARHRDHHRAGQRAVPVAQVAVCAWYGWRRRPSR
jgi:hypothetical protein